VDIETAKTKWCPFARGPEGGGYQHYSCIADECMCWRWDPADGRASGYFKDGTSIEGDGHISNRSGYCGLAK